jgi:uncharacterized protein
MRHAATALQLCSGTMRLHEPTQMNLSAAEIRVLGCLLEKQRTTPDAYPLTLNALRLACNQATNREPVVDFDEATVRDAVHRLERRGFARLASGRGSRAPKYRHLLAEALPLDRGEQALMCVLMLRGPQTPGELKQRSERMHEFAGTDELSETLARLGERQLVERLARRPGQKEDRYAQRLEQDRSAGQEAPMADHAALGEGSHTHTADEPSEPGAGATGAEHRALTLAGLEERIARLEREVAELRAVHNSAVASASEPAASDADAADRLHV